MAKPFIKWVGGKSHLLAHIRRLMPEKYSRYVEPFLGGGALFFALEPRHAVLGDINKELVYLYQQVKKDWSRVAVVVDDYMKTHCENQYYFLRDKLNEKRRRWFASKQTKFETATLFYYLIKSCYNGMVQVNKHGDYTFPHGHKRNRSLCNANTLAACSAVLRNTKVKLCIGDYKKVAPKKGDFFFLAPPYDGSQMSYSKLAFTKQHQRELAEFCKTIDRKQARFVLCNNPVISKTCTDRFTS